MTIAEKLVDIEKLAMSGPQLSDSERAEYERICARISRASADLRRAKKRSDAKKAASAERSLANASVMRDEFLAPKVSHLWAPARIIAKFERHWSGPSGSGSGIHHHTCEMILDHKDLSGPSYRKVRVLKDEGGPPTNARSAPDVMGVAWFAITDLIKCGKIVVLGEKEPSCRWTVRAPRCRAYYASRSMISTTPCDCVPPGRGVTVTAAAEAKFRIWITASANGVSKTTSPTSCAVPVA